MVNNGLVVFIDNFVAVGIQRVDDEKGLMCRTSSYIVDVCIDVSWIYLF